MFFVYFFIVKNFKLLLNFPFYTVYYFLSSYHVFEYILLIDFLIIQTTYVIIKIRYPYKLYTAI